MMRLLRCALVLSVLVAGVGLVSPPAAQAAPPAGELITNGGFESGFTGWTLYNNGAGGIALNNGTFIPTGFPGPLPPISGSWDAVTWQGGPGAHRLAQMVTVPPSVSAATLSWKDRLQNAAGVYIDPVCGFDYWAGCPVQDWKVVVYDAAWNLIQEVHSTNPGDPPIQLGPNARSVDVTALLQGLAGQTIWIGFIEADNQLFFSATLDDVSLQVAPLPVASVANSAATEGAGTLTFTVSLDNPWPVPVSVDWVTVDNSAVSPADYTAGSGTVTFPAGSTTQTVSVPIAEDNIDEVNENFRVQLSNPVNCTIAGNGRATGIILDNDATPRISIMGATGYENVGSLGFAVLLNRPSSRTVTVNFTTIDGTGVAPGDYTASAGVVSFAPGVTAQWIAVTVIDDALREGAENFKVKLSSPVFATLAPVGAGVGTIVDND